MPQLIKKILLVYISIVLTFAPFSVFAASAGGWSFSSFNAATGVVTAMKNGATAATAVAKSPITSKIAKGILGGVIAGAAIPLAISQISGIALNAVDWVFDPANNAIKYRTKPLPAGTLCYNWGGYSNGYFLDEQKAKEFFKSKNGRYPTSSDGNYTTGDLTKCGVVVNYQSVSIPTVAAKIYDNAKTDTDSATVVSDAVREYK